jgi:hypothetical protein
MRRTPLLWAVPLSAAFCVFALSAAAQTSGGPAGWVEKWTGLYGQQDRAGRVAPPGYKVLLVHELPDAAKRGPHEPDEIEVVESLLQPWARARTDATDYELEDGGTICRPSGLFLAGQGGAFELLASPEKLTMILMAGGGIHTGGIRRIYLNRPHLKNPPLTYYGDSVGHWEGDTLVIDVIGFNEKTWLTRDRARHSEALHVVERWCMIAVGNDEWIEKTITVDDRFALTKPYTLTRYQKKLPLSNPVNENLCQDTPESRRAWVKLYQRALKEHDEHRKALASGGTKAGVE